MKKLIRLQRNSCKSINVLTRMLNIMQK